MSTWQQRRAQFEKCVTQDRFVPRQHDFLYTKVFLMPTQTPSCDVQRQQSWATASKKVLRWVRSPITAESKHLHPWSKTPGFKGRRMLGTLKTKGKKMVVQLISMVQQGRLVTVTLLTAKDTPAANKLIESIAAAAKI